MERADHDLAVDLTIGKWPATMRAHGGQGTNPAVPQSKDGYLILSDPEGTALPYRNLVHRAEQVLGQRRGGHKEAPVGTWPGCCAPESAGIASTGALRTGTFGSTSRGSDVRNWPGTRGLSRSNHGST